ncbi:hypothetical protein ACI79J_07460 [Geodermatophilus sp. SYSU D01062]
MSQLTRRIAVTVGIAAAVVGGATPALAAPPVIERIPVDDTFADDFLSGECGVDVTTTIRGQIITRELNGGGNSPLELSTVNLTVTATSANGSYRLKDVGADLLRQEADGTLVLSVIGQVPFGFTGILRVNPDTGEVLFEPQHNTEDDLEEACAVLRGD